MRDHRQVHPDFLVGFVWTFEVDVVRFGLFHFIYACPWSAKKAHRHLVQAAFFQVERFGRVHFCVQRLGVKKLDPWLFHAHAHTIAVGPRPFTSL